VRPVLVIGFNLSVNHGGVLVMSASDVSLSPIAAIQPTSFELVCAQAATGSLSVIVVALYRPGSEAVQQKFFDELADVFGLFAHLRRRRFQRPARSSRRPSRQGSYGNWLTATVWNFTAPGRHTSWVERWTLSSPTSLLAVLNT